MDVLNIRGSHSSEISLLHSLIRSLDHLVEKMYCWITILIHLKYLFGDTTRSLARASVKKR